MEQIKLITALSMDEQTRIEVEAAAFRQLVKHFRKHTEVQNIDLMILASFCRNCLSKWYRAAADERGHELSYEECREIIYGIPYSEWKGKFQLEATDEQKAAYKAQQEAAGQH